MRAPRACTAWLLALLVLLSTPAALAQERGHERFLRAESDPAALHALGDTLLNFTERALERTLDADDANASRRALLVRGLGDDLEVIAGLDEEEVESAGLLRPLVGPYSRVGDNLTVVVEGIADLRQRAPTTSTAGLARLVRADVLALHGDADAFDALGHDTARLRELLALLLGLVDELERRLPPVPAPGLFLLVEPADVPLGDPFVVRGVAFGADPAGLRVSLRLDGAPWAEVSTDASGGFRHAGAARLDERLGVHVVRADATLDGRNVSAEARYNVTKIPSRLALSVDRERVPANATLGFTGRLADHRGAPIAGSSAMLRIGDEPARSIAFRSDGAFALRHALGDLAPGRHRANLTYAGDARHEAAFAEIEWEVVDAGIVDAPREKEGSWLAPLAAAPPWLWWILLLLLVLGAEQAAALHLRRRPLRSPAASRRIETVVDRLAPLPKAPALDDPRVFVVMAYRDLLRRLLRDGVSVEALTPREVARACIARGGAPDAAWDVALAFEAARYSGEPMPERRVPSYLRSLARLLGAGP